MMREIVLGDLWGIDESVWVQLWSGTLGAVISAGVAAWVAVAVLKRSNRKQQELVALQLAEQRKEAEQARRSIVLADLLTVANGFIGAVEESPEALKAHRLKFESHAYRWELEGRVPGQELELLKWSITLYGPAMAISRLKDAPPDMRQEWISFLDEVVSAFSALCLSMGFIPDKKRLGVLKLMAERRGEFRGRWEGIYASAKSTLLRRPGRIPGAE